MIHTNAQAALQAAVDFYEGHDVGRVLSTAEAFKAWIDTVDSRDVGASQTALEDAWNKGHESGFWNGRESAGSGEMKLMGADHAKAVNPYSARAPVEGEQP